MPAFVSFATINMNTSAQNAGVFIGTTNITGFDAHLKINIGGGSQFGFRNISNYQSSSFTFDGYEAFDGIINDQDFKPSFSYQF